MGFKRCALETAVGRTADSGQAMRGYNIWGGGQKIREARGKAEHMSPKWVNEQMGEVGSNMTGIQEAVGRNAVGSENQA